MEKRHLHFLRDLLPAPPRPLEIFLKQKHHVAVAAPREDLVTHRGAHEEAQDLGIDRRGMLGHLSGRLRLDDHGHFLNRLADHTRQGCQNLVQQRLEIVGIEPDGEGEILGVDAVRLEEGSVGFLEPAHGFEDHSLELHALRIVLLACRRPERPSLLQCFRAPPEEMQALGMPEGGSPMPGVLLQKLFEDLERDLVLAVFEGACSLLGERVQRIGIGGHFTWSWRFGRPGRAAPGSRSRWERAAPPGRAGGRCRRTGRSGPYRRGIASP